jgi:hypothetical protein
MDETVAGQAGLPSLMPRRPLVAMRRGINMPAWGIESSPLGSESPGPAMKPTE